MLEQLILGFILAFGIITSYEDIKHNRIRNKWVLLAIAFGVVASLTTNFYLKNPVSPLGISFLGEFYINALCAFVLGYILWYTGLWSAGDAKLFLAYAFIIPIGTYQMGFLPYFPSVALLVNTFTPFLLFFIIYVLVKVKKSLSTKMLRRFLQPKLLTSIAIFLFGFGWIISALFLALGIPNNAILQLVGLFIIILVASRYLKFRLLAVSVILSVLRLILDFKNYATIQYLGSFLLFMAIMLLLRFYLLSLSYEVFSKEIFIENIKPGMISAEDVYRTAKTAYKKRRFAYFSFIEALLRKSQETSIFNRMGDGLTPNEVAVLKRAHSMGHLPEHSIRIYQTLPFAPFMFFGAILSLIITTDIALFIRILIENFI